MQKAAERMLLAQYAPAGVIVDDALNVVHVRGETGPYLHLAPGEPTYNLLRMAREGLAVGLRTAFVNARRTRAATAQVAHVKQNGQLKEVNLKVIPINAPVRAGALHFMVLFEDVAPTATPGPIRAEGQATGGAKPVKAAGPRSARENTRLKQELAATREYLQSIIEEQEASTEELKSANEEAQASNEELATAKEELQSANEELNTVNDELRTRNAALIEVNNDQGILVLFSCEETNSRIHDRQRRLLRGSDHTLYPTRDDWGIWLRGNRRRDGVVPRDDPASGI